MIRVTKRDDEFVVSIDNKYGPGFVCRALSSAQAQDLVDQLAALGIVGSECAATERHLADMRQLVFQQRE